METYFQMVHIFVTHHFGNAMITKAVYIHMMFVIKNPTVQMVQTKMKTYARTSHAITIHAILNQNAFILMTFVMERKAVQREMMKKTVCNAPKNIVNVFRQVYLLACIRFVMVKWTVES